MHRKRTVDTRRAHPAIFLGLAWVLAACSNGAGGTPAAGSSGLDGGSDDADAGAVTPSDDSSTTGAGDANQPVDGASGKDATSSTDGSAVRADAGDGGVVTADAGGGDGGLRNVGSCCSAQTTPGCNDGNVAVCVCQKDPTCCTTVWGLQCALIVQQKYCQTGVRDCVCGTDADAGQWGQTQCCSTDWTSTCDIVATSKCGAVQGCF